MSATAIHSNSINVVTRHGQGAAVSNVQGINASLTTPVPHLLVPNSQQGVVLFVMLMLLIIMSLIAAWSVKTVTFETKIAAYQAFRDQALIRAESAVISMENCITGVTPYKAGESCDADGTPLGANTPFIGEVAGFLSRGVSGEDNLQRSSNGYWAGYFTTTGQNNFSHDWSNSYAKVNTPGLASSELPRVTVERQNQVDLGGFSSDNASQGIGLGQATPFRITANSRPVGSTTPTVLAIVQSVIYIPSATITTPD
jgi:Tfp pilus assembly protein PilX